MRYTILLHYPEMTVGSDGGLSEEAMAEGERAFSSYAATLHDAGVLISAEVLQPSTATTTLSLDDEGKIRVQDGPFTDSKEQLGGTFVIDVADLDQAISWAGRAPSVGWGHVEVRPGATHVVDGSWQPNA